MEYYIIRLENSKFKFLSIVNYVTCIFYYIYYIIIVTPNRSSIHALLICI